MLLGFFVVGLFAVSFLLILLEAFFIPGFGLGGVLGFIGLGTACVLAFTHLSILFGWITTLAGIFLVIAFLKIFPRTSAWRRLRLDQAETTDQGFQSADPTLKKLLHKTGIALTMLRPSGNARIDGKRYDVTSGSDFIDKDAPVIVTKIEGNKIVVAAKKKA